LAQNINNMMGAIQQEAEINQEYMALLEQRRLEMEYLADAESLTRAMSRMKRRERRRFQVQIGERLLFTVLYHIFKHNELHGDLHPGNVMIGSDGALHLIDWGNVVSLDGKWGAVWDYLAGAIVADTAVLTDTLVAMSTKPEENQRNWAQIKATLDDTLLKKGVTPLTRVNFVFELKRGGIAGLHRRGQTVLQLMSNTQQAGLVLRRDYLHLSRALFAAAGSFGALYDKTSGRQMLGDVLRTVLRLPLTVAQDQIDRKFYGLRQRMVQSIPLPRRWRDILFPPPPEPRALGQDRPKPLVLPPDFAAGGKQL
ncbi:MAG: AarF/UbiB family protein, partial [Panacagrimonas sp.]